MRRKLIVLVLFILSAVTTIAIQVSLEKKADSLENQNYQKTIHFYDGGWENIKINNAIAMYVIENGYHFPVKSIETRVPEMQNLLVKGELDVNMEMWRVLMNEWVSEQLESGTIFDLGPTYEAGSQGFYVPTYVIEGEPEREIEPMAPNLRSVKDLITYQKVFSNPENSNKGIWLNCMQGWACREINLIKMATYGIDNHFNAVEPSNEREWNEWITNAYEKGEPIVTYYWDPSPLLGTLKMTKLEEPPHTEDCWNEIEKVLSNFSFGDSSEKACAYQTVSIHKFVSSRLQEKAPEVFKFLKTMFVGTATIRELGGYMKQNQASPEATALFFLRNYEDQWKNWVSEETYQDIKESLQANSQEK